MSATQTSRSPDLARLEAEGYRLRIVHGAASEHVLVDGIPYLNSKREVRYGTLYSPLELTAAQTTQNPVRGHQCWWIGEEPYDAKGQVMEAMISGRGEENKGDGIKTMMSFSRKNPDKKTPYPSYYEKLLAYIDLLWVEAFAVNPNCSPRGKPVPAVVEASKRVFKYPDMATTRAGIGVATARLIDEKIAIIGIGGTGSYILDLLAKTPVAQIDIYDGDDFELHNAFRSPGAPALSDFVDEVGNPQKRTKKVDWFGDIYDRMREGINRHPYDVMPEHMDEFKQFTLVFVAVDSPAARKWILMGLMERGISFIDVGIDIAFDKEERLSGMTRVTVGTKDKHDHIEQVVSFADRDRDEVYRNIQVADLNMRNAADAVEKWKKIRGFYADSVREHHSLYTLDTHSMTKEDRT